MMFSTDFFNGQTDPIVGNALIYTKSGGKRGGYPIGFVGAAGLDVFHPAQGFDNACKHNGHKIREFIVKCFRKCYLCRPKKKQLYYVDH